MSEYRDPIDAALEELTVLRIRAQKIEAASMKPPAPDPELEELFANFARRMSSHRRPKKLIEESEVLESAQESYGVFGIRKREVQRKIKRRRELGEGWPIIGVGRTISDSPSPRRRNCLAISTESLPFFVIIENDDESLYTRAGFMQPLSVTTPFSVVGRPLGSNLRHVISFGLNLGWREPVRDHELPTFIAKAMASEIGRPTGMTVE